MITSGQITEIGRFNQPHGIKGEVNAVIYENIDLEDLSCIILDIDGIFVPFFISGARSRGAQSCLISIDGIDCEQKASLIANKAIYALKEEVDASAAADDTEGFYAEDLIGFEIFDQNECRIGIVKDIDDSTENILFLVENENGKIHMIPVADELISDIDPDRRLITMTLPEGLLDI